MLTEDETEKVNSDRGLTVEVLKKEERATLFQQMWLEAGILCYFLLKSIMREKGMMRVNDMFTVLFHYLGLR